MKVNNEINKCENLTEFLDNKVEEKFDLKYPFKSYFVRFWFELDLVFGPFPHCFD